MRTLLIALSTTLLLATPASATPTLTTADAKRLLDRTLQQRFGNAYENGSYLSPSGQDVGPRLACRRLSRLRHRCTARWFAGDSEWSTRALVRRIRPEFEDGTWTDRVEHTTRLTDGYCQDTGGTGCTETTRGRRSFPSE